MYYRYPSSGANNVSTYRLQRDSSKLQMKIDLLHGLSDTDSIKITQRFH